MIKKYLFYLIRWQLSTPILAGVLLLMSKLSTLEATLLANLIGGLIFFWVDKFIFRALSKEPMWEIKEEVGCTDCGSVETGYRIVEWMKYNRKNEKVHQYRCEKCRHKKMTEIAKKIQ